MIITFNDDCFVDLMLGCFYFLLSIFEGNYLEFNCLAYHVLRKN